MGNEPQLEPFEPHILSAIRTAFQAGWSEMSQELVTDVTSVRNKLVGTIATLASKGVLDPHELKEQALNALGLSPHQATPETTGGTSNAEPNS